MNSLYAPLYLPQGATIIDVEFIYFDEQPSAPQMGLSLVRREPVSTVETTMASFITVTDTGNPDRAAVVHN